MTILPLLLQAASLAAPTVTLSEATAMSPNALAERLLPGQAHGVMVDAIINGRGLTPPSQSVNRVWLVEQMVPFSAKFCRSHVYRIEMGSSDPTAKPWATATPTYPAKIEQYDRLWVPPAGIATVATCAAAPPRVSGFGDGSLGLNQAADLVDEARTAFLSGKSQAFAVSCQGQRGVCGSSPRKTLAAIDWSALGLVERVSSQGAPYFAGDAKPKDGAWGPSDVQFTFPYAAGGSTWVITVHRAPRIISVRMDALAIVYH